MPFWSTSSHKTHEQPPDPETAGADPDYEKTAQNDAAASASAAAGTEWLSGHLNHLSTKQEGKLVEFKRLCADKGYYTAAGAGTGEDADGVASHDDATMLYVFSLRADGVIG